MRIALDSRIIAQSNTGIARYTVGLVRAWQHKYPEDSWIYVTHQRFTPKEHGLDAGFEQLTIPFPGQSILRPAWEKFLLPIGLKKIDPKPDVFFSPLGAVAPDLDIPCIVTIHDLAFKRHPEILPLHYRIYWNWVIQRASEHACALIAVSDSTVRDLAELTDTPKDRIFRVYEGVDEQILTEPSPDALAEIRNRFGLPEEFLLFVGTLEPRKNVPFLLDAYEHITDCKVPLVLAGGWGWSSDALRERIVRMSPNVLPTDSLSMSDLSCLYRSATVFVFPSLYEGFGLPLIEAMACGLPVVAARSSSVPEIVDQAGILVDLGDSEKFADEIGNLLNDPEKRRKLANAGLERSKEFTWNRAAEETRKVFSDVPRK